MTRRMPLPRLLTAAGLLAAARLLTAAGLLACAPGLVPAALEAQGRRGPREPVEPEENVPYDGRFTFVRIRYAPAGGMFGSRGGFDAKWDHDYPRAERHFTRILEELSTIRARTTVSNVLTLDDPRLSRFPVAYLSEPGFWVPNEKEIEGLRGYLARGGFLIFDDFEGSHWFNFEAQVRRVLPGSRLVPLTPAHPIFDSFYRITTFDGFAHPYSGRPSQFYGVFEDNDPARRLLLIANYNSDMAEYWEFSDTGFFPIDLSNEAYKLGVNYLVYALSR